MKRNRNAAYLGYFDQHHKAKSRRHNDQDDNEPIAYSEEDFMDTFEVERNDGQDDFDDEKVVSDVVNTVNKAGETFHRIRVADFESKVSKVYKSFQFVDVVNRVVKFMNDPNHCLKRDDHHRDLYVPHVTPKVTQSYPKKQKLPGYRCQATEKRVTSVASYR